MAPLIDGRALDRGGLLPKCRDVLRCEHGALDTTRGLDVIEPSPPIIQRQLALTVADLRKAFEQPKNGLILGHGRSSVLQFHIVAEWFT